MIGELWSRGLWNNASDHYQQPAKKPPPTASGAPPAQNDSDRIAFAQRLWRAASPAVNSPVASYLQSRGITFGIPDAIRFHPHLKHPSDGTWPGMLALVTRGTDGEPLAIHRTFLARDGSGKAPVASQKMMFGPCQGGAVRLAAFAGKLMVGEGIETCLSAMQATSLPAWAALSTAGLRALRLPAEIEEVIVLADNDAAGIGAALNSALQWETDGKEVRIAVPPFGNDFNDTLCAEGGQDKIKQAVQEARDCCSFLIERAESAQVDMFSDAVTEFLARVKHERTGEYEDILQRIKGSPNIKVSITELRKEIRRKHTQRKQNIEEKEKQERAGDDAKIMDFVEQNLDAFYTPEGIAYAGIKTETGIQYHRIDSERLKNWIVSQYSSAYRKLLHKQKMGSLVDYAKACAQNADEKPVYQHLGFKGENIYVCLGYEPPKVVKINASGWQVIEHAPVRFEWTRAPALPPPERDGTLEDLRSILNIKDVDGLELIKSWLLALFQRDGGYPLLVLTGEQGTAKTTAAGQGNVGQEQENVGTWGYPKRLLSLPRLARRPEVLYLTHANVQSVGITVQGNQRVI